ncbi:MAG: amidohydrolase family protein [Clostridia bacterium]|nr:amidohydrolase family protein [Clostridia bacterium]
MSLIDFHTHIFPDKIAPAAVASLAQAGGTRPEGGTGTLDDLEGVALREGISLCVNLPVATRPDQAASINRFAREVNRREGRVISFGAIHPDAAEPERELAELAEAGFRGIKLHPDYQGHYADDPAVIRVVKEAKRLGLHTVFHGGVDIAFPNDVHAAPERISRLLSALGEGVGKVIVAHIGGYRLWDDVERVLVGQDVLFDLSYGIDHLPPEQLLRIVTRHGADRILFGSDYPWRDPADIDRVLSKLPLSDGQFSLIRSGNAERLLGLDTCARAE